MSSSGPEPDTDKGLMAKAIIHRKGEGRIKATEEEQPSERSLHLNGALSVGKCLLLGADWVTRWVAV